MYLQLGGVAVRGVEVKVCCSDMYLQLGGVAVRRCCSKEVLK